MASRFFRNKTNKRKKTNKGKKNKRSSLKAGATNYKSIVYAQKNVIQDLKQQNQVLQSQVSQQSNLIQGLKGQNSVYSSDQSSGNGNIAQAMNDINKTQQKILRLLSVELNKKSPDMNKVNRLASLNQLGASTINEITQQSAIATPLPNVRASSSNASNASNASSAVAGVAAGAALSGAAQENSDAADELVGHLSNAVNSAGQYLSDPETQEAIIKNTQRAAKATGKILADKDVQKHAIAYAGHGLNAAMDTGKYLQDALNGKATTASTIALTGTLAGHGLKATNSLFKAMASAHKAATTPSAK